MARHAPATRAGEAGAGRVGLYPVTLEFISISFPAFNQTLLTVKEVEMADILRLKRFRD
jgi:hypothetical protein